MSKEINEEPYVAEFKKNNKKVTISTSVKITTHDKVQALAKTLDTTASVIYERGALAFVEAMGMIGDEVIYGEAHATKENERILNLFLK